MLSVRQPFDAMKQGRWTGARAAVTVMVRAGDFPATMTVPDLDRNGCVSVGNARFDERHVRRPRAWLDATTRTNRNWIRRFEVVDPPLVTSPLVFSSPHSGSIYPRRFLESARLDATALRRSEDAFVDELFAGARDLGAPLIRARFPRAYLDLNREPYELDPRMFDGRLPGFVNTRSVQGRRRPRHYRPRWSGESQEIYAGRLGVEEGLQQDRSPLQTLSRAPGANAGSRSRGVRHRRAYRLPFDAV